MAVAKIDPLELPGPWTEGYVLERQHTLNSEYVGHDSNGRPRFETTRSELGDLVFRLKNRSDRATLDPIAATAADFVRRWGIQVDAVVPVPPSAQRAFQPVVEIARRLGAQLPRPVLDGAVTKVRATPELKDVSDYAERQALLADAFTVDSGSVSGLRLLLVDDLYRSGATAAVVARDLIAAGANAVYFLAMTKTRTRS